MSILRQHLSSRNFTLAWTEHYMNLRSPKRMKHFSETLVATESGITKHMHRFDSKTATSQNQSWDKSIRWHRRQQARLSGLLFHYVRKRHFYIQSTGNYMKLIHMCTIFTAFSLSLLSFFLFITHLKSDTHTDHRNTHTVLLTNESNTPLGKSLSLPGRWQNRDTCMGGTE